MKSGNKSSMSPFELHPPRVTWSLLATALRNRFSVATGVGLLAVPALQKILERLPDVLVLTLGEQSEFIELNLTLPFSVKTFYFSCLCFFLANLMFIFRGPKFIKSFENAGSAISQGVTAQVLQIYALEALSLIKAHPWMPEAKKTGYLQRLANLYWFGHLGGCFLPGDPGFREIIAEAEFKENLSMPSYYFVVQPNGQRPELLQREQLLKFQYRRVLECMNCCRPISRWVTAVFLFIGIGLAIYPLAQSVLFMLRN